MKKFKKSRTPIQHPAADDRRPSLTPTPSTWSKSGSTLTSKMNVCIAFPFDGRAKKKKKSVHRLIQSAFTDIPRIVEVPLPPEFLIVLDENDVVNEGVESIIVRNNNRIDAIEV